jgi:hypothetical protein
MSVLAVTFTSHPKDLVVMRSLIPLKIEAPGVKESGHPQNRKNLMFLTLMTFCFLFLTGITAAGERAGEGTASVDQSLKLNAYTQACYVHREEAGGGFKIRQARVVLKGNVFKDIRFKLQVDSARTPILLDAEIVLGLSSYARFTIGQFKVPFGIENLIPGADLDMINRSNTVNLLCPGRPTGAVGRDIGIVVSGRISSLMYTMGVFNGSGINQSDLNGHKDLAGRLVFSPFSELAFGLSHYAGKYSPLYGAPVVKKSRTGVDLFFVHDGFSLKGEYILVRDTQMEGYGFYVQGGCFLLHDKIEVLTKYDFVDTDFIDRIDRFAVITLGINYFFSKRTKFQINYEYHREGSTEAPRSVILAQFQAGF